MDEFSSVESPRGWQHIEIDTRRAWEEITGSRQIRPRIGSMLRISDTPPRDMRDLRLDYIDIKRQGISNYHSLKDLCAALGHLDIADDQISIPDRWCISEDDLRSVLTFTSNIIHQKRMGEISKRAPAPFRLTSGQRNLVFVKDRDGTARPWVIWLAEKPVEERRSIRYTASVHEGFRQHYSPNELLEWQIWKKETKADERVSVDRLIIPSVS